MALSISKTGLQMVRFILKIIINFSNKTTRSVVSKNTPARSTHQDSNMDLGENVGSLDKSMKANSKTESIMGTADKSTITLSTLENSEKERETAEAKESGLQEKKTKDPTTTISTLTSTN